MKISTLQQTKNANERDAVMNQYLSIQEKLSAARTLVETIRDAIKKVADGATTAFDGVPKTEVLRKAYDDISAALALGQITPAEAKQRREELNAQRSLIITAEVGATEAKSAQSGLEARLEDSLQKINVLEIQERELFTKVLIAEAEKAGEQYVSAAEALVEQYLRLNYLREMVKYSGSGFSSWQFHELFIPALPLQAFEGKVHKNRSAILCDQMFLEYSGRNAASIEMERQRLGELGVVMPDPSVPLKEWFEKPQREADERLQRETVSIE